MARYRRLLRSGLDFTDYEAYPLWMRLYLAGPMEGISEYNFPLFHEYAADLRRLGFRVFNPAETWYIPQTWRRILLCIDCTWICLRAEGIALLPGWEKSRGATAERALAVALGLKVIEL